MDDTPGPAKFTAPGRQIYDENFIQLTSVGVDIGSSTTHLVFSRLELERQGPRYVTVNKTLSYESEILMTPYVDGTTIDGPALGRFISQQYDAARLKREDVDTGALILTGVALQRQNSRSIADLFAEEAGRFVAVSAGDNMEATLAAHGSGAVSLSATNHNTILNIDIGGGTTKLAICANGRVNEVAAINIGARLIVLDNDGTVLRVEDAGHIIGQATGVDLTIGRQLKDQELESIASYMADVLLQVGGLALPSLNSQALMRTLPLSYNSVPDVITFSGGVSEYIYRRESESFGDLGEVLAKHIKAKTQEAGIRVWSAEKGIRATVIGASQYTVQVSGNTIYLSPLDAVPVRNVPVVLPALALDDADIDPSEVRIAVESALDQFDLKGSDLPVAVAFRWGGSASYSRIDLLCTGILEAMKHSLSNGNPLVLVCDGDVGGLLGIHLKEEMKLEQPVISIDGIELKEFDHIDIGTIIPTSGSVPVVIKSLVFPTPTILDN